MTGVFFLRGRKQDERAASKRPSHLDLSYELVRVRRAGRHKERCIVPGRPVLTMSIVV